MKTLYYATLLIFLSFFLIGKPSPAVAQENNVETLSYFSRTSFFLEWRGNAHSYSLNVDHLVSRQISLRAGVALLPSFFCTVLAVPVMVNYLAGQETHFLELGLGVLLGGEVTNSEAGFGVFIPTMTIGYRRQPPDGGFLFRAGLTPFIVPTEINFFYPMYGVSIGYTFR